MLLERPHAYWLVSDSPHLYKLSRLKVRVTGVPALRKIQGRLKPTTAVVRVFGLWATKSVVDLDRQRLTDLLHHGHIYLSPSISPGYVILTHETHILGCGLYTGHTLLNQIPRGYRPRL